MSRALIVSIVTAFGGIGVALITAVVGPIIYPWYGERLGKAQRRVQRRQQTRQMIENELAKGLLDLASVGGYFMMLLTEIPGTAQARFTQSVVDNETKGGVWVGYAVEDAALRTLCDEYRDVIRDSRIVASRPPPLAPDMEEQLAGVRQAADEKASVIVKKLNELGW